MARLLKSKLLIVWVLSVALAACAPAATPIPPTATNPPRPTGTPMPPPAIIPKPTSSSVQGKFDAGGVNLYIECLGEGSPTVVFDSAWGDDSTPWMEIMLDLRSHTRVCMYDRANMGQSDAQAGLTTSAQIVKQLHTLLANAKVEGPYLPVGHSVGGMNMLLFASRYPGEVAGLVLVDSAHPDQADRSLAVLPTPAPDETEAMVSLRKAIPWHNPEGIPEPMNWEETLDQVCAVKSLGNLPLAVLVAVDPETSGMADIPPEVSASLDRVWLDLHQEYTSLSTNGSLILAKHSGHYIQNDEPQLVIDTILDLVDKARQK